MHAIRAEVETQPGWLARAILAGFIASMLMLFAFVTAYGLATALASGWFAGLTANPVIDLARPNLYAAVAVHITVGLAFALVYARFFEPRLSGPGWRRGLMFSLVPWLLSLLVFLPLVGGGLLGMALGAGPLPAIGNLILHAVYGLTLGVLYGPAGQLVTDSSFHAPTGADALANARMERGAAIGIVAGLGLGILTGLVAMGLASAAGQGTVLGMHPLAFLIATGLLGGSFGALVGSLAGQ
jgi:hypothetical protein